MKHVLSVGQCGVDNASIRGLIERSFDARVLNVDDAAETLAALRREPFDLVLVNRKLDLDYSDGLDIIRQIKADPGLAKTPCMLISNYPDQQQLAIAAGAEPGFGKSQLHRPETREQLARLLD